MAIIAGAVLLVGGIWGIAFTYQNIAQENIVTPDDASIPNADVRGPLTLKSQADVMRKHALEMTGGMTYAEMPRQVEKIDERGEVVTDGDGSPVMIPNAARNTWVTVTALTTALNLAILAYAFSTFTILIGAISVWTGIVFWALGGKQKR